MMMCTAGSGQAQCRSQAPLPAACCLTPCKGCHALRTLCWDIIFNLGSPGRHYARLTHHRPPCRAQGKESIEAAVQGKTSRFLLRSIWGRHQWRILFALALQLFYSGIQFAGPIMLNQITKILTKPSSQQVGVRREARGKFAKGGMGPGHARGSFLPHAAPAALWRQRSGGLAEVALTQPSPAALSAPAEFLQPAPGRRHHLRAQPHTCLPP